jgi:hypothetical protein
MGGCGMEGLMYKKVQPCDFLCHPYAADLIMLTVEVLAHDLEVRSGSKDVHARSSDERVQGLYLCRLNRFLTHDRRSLT